MSENKILTINQLKDKYAQNNGYENWYDYLNYCKSNGFDESEIGYNDLIKFCIKYHLEAQLSAILENAYIDNNHRQGDYFDFDNFEINKDSITNAYPINNIK